MMDLDFQISKLLPAQLVITSTEICTLIQRKQKKITTKNTHPHIQNDWSLFLPSSVKTFSHFHITHLRASSCWTLSHCDQTKWSPQQIFTTRLKFYTMRGTHSLSPLTIYQIKKQQQQTLLQLLWTSFERLDAVKHASKAGVQFKVGDKQQFTHIVRTYKAWELSLKTKQKHTQKKPTTHPEKLKKAGGWGWVGWWVGGVNTYLVPRQQTFRTLACWHGFVSICWCTTTAIQFSYPPPFLFFPLLSSKVICFLKLNKGSFLPKVCWLADNSHAYQCLWGELHAHDLRGEGKGLAMYAVSN